MNPHMFLLAREQSFNSDYTGQNARVGCVAVLHNTVIAKGFNTDKTHTLQDKYNHFRYRNEGGHYFPSKCHSELAALQKIKYLDIDFGKIELYIYREIRSGKVAMARPCKACMAAIRDLGIKTIHYTTDSGYATEYFKETK